MRPETIGPYRILETLREGGVSSVYKAAGPGGAAVALKVFSLQVLAPLAASNAGSEAAPRSQQAEDLVARFHREVGAVVPLSHPNILQVIGTGQDGDHVFLATELFDGLSLERLLKQRRLTVPQSIAVLRAVCRGLVFAHARGFVHGHLSPRHVLVSPDVRAVKIADFGPSESDVVSELDSTLRTGAYALGSMHYLAPEQIGRRGAPPDPRSDLYAAGAMLVELLTGRLPAGKLALPSHVNAELPPLTDIVVLKCLERDPGQRYPSAVALLADLDRLEEAMRLRLHSHLRGISRLLGPPGSSRRTVLLAALALLLVALALAVYLIGAR